MDNNAKFIIEFKAQMKELNDAFKKLAKFTEQHSVKQKRGQASTKKAGKEELDTAAKLSKLKIKDEKSASTARRVAERERKALVREEDKSRRAAEKERRTIAKFSKEQEKQLKSAARSGGILGGLIGGGIGLAGKALGSLYNFGVGALGSAQDARVQYKTAMGGNVGLAANGRDILKNIPSSTRANRLGFNKIESAQMMPLMARATGVLDPSQMQQTMRATGLGAGEAAGLMGTLTQAGTSFKGKQGGKEVSRMIESGFRSGLVHERLPELFDGIQSLMQEQMGRSSRDVSPTGALTMLSMLQKSGLSGFAGARGVQVATKLSSAMTRPGGGEYGDTFMRQAMGFGKPGGTTGYYEAEKMREQGITGKGGIENFQKVMTELKNQFGTGKEANLMLRELTGVSLEQAEDLQNVFNSGKDANKQQEEIKKILDEGKPLEKKAQEAMVGAGKWLEKIAKQSDAMLAQGEKLGKLFDEMDKQFLALFKKISEELVPHLPELIAALKGFTSAAISFTGVMGDLVDFLQEYFGTKDSKATTNQLKQNEGPGRVLIKEASKEAAKMTAASKKRLQDPNIFGDDLEDRQGYVGGMVAQLGYKKLKEVKGTTGNLTDEESQYIQNLIKEGKMQATGAGAGGIPELDKLAKSIVDKISLPGSTSPTSAGSGIPGLTINNFGDIHSEVIQGGHKISSNQKSRKSK